MGWAGSYRHRKLGSYGECPTMNRNHFSISEGGICTEISLFTDPALLYFTNIFNLRENSLNLQLILLSELSMSLLIQKTITCFEKSEGSGDLLDQDRFLLLKSATVDKVLICPDLDYQKLQDSIQNSGE